MFEILAIILLAIIAIGIASNKNNNTEFISTRYTDYKSPKKYNHRKNNVVSYNPKGTYLYKARNGKIYDHKESPYEYKIRKLMSK